MIRENGGWDMFRMIEIKHHPCNNRREAEAEEDKIMREMKSTMNTNRAYLSEEETDTVNKEYRKKYNTKHSDTIKVNAKTYRDKQRAEFETDLTMEKYLEHLLKQKEKRDAYKERQKNKAT